MLQNRHDVLVQSSLFNLSFLLQVLFAVWGGGLKSHAHHKRLTHPHPDYRKRLTHEVFTHLLAESPDARKIWLAQCDNAEREARLLFSSIGASGAGATQFFGAPPIVGLGNTTIAARLDADYRNFLDQARVFSMYVNDFLKPGDISLPLHVNMLDKHVCASHDSDRS